MTQVGTGGRVQPHILMLDDDPFMLAMQSRTMQSMGYTRVSAVDSAPAALAFLRAAPGTVDVIICDLNMPGMDGIEFLQMLNGTDLFRGSVILLSGEGARIMHTVQKLLGGGRLLVLGALEKPARQPALLALLDRWRPGTAIAPTVPRWKLSEAELRVAIEQSQWLLHYQPQVDLRTGTLTGMEALVRWAHPQHGLVGPDSFITLAEESGAIEALTDWVLRAAMGQLVAWHAAGLRLQMAINVSMENVREPAFARRVAAIARDTGASSHDVMLEITESRLMAPSATPLECLVRLRLQRFGLSIDDFGTGHSSLAQLRDVPFTELKVDRGFVRGARTNQIVRPMLEGSIGIAKRLGMRSVAEGVETEDDWRLLQELGCDLAQGWFIGRAMPVDEVSAWLADWRVRSVRLIDPQA